MSTLVKILYDVAALRAKYQRLHQAQFQLSARTILDLVNRPKASRYEAVRVELERLAGRLESLRGELDKLEDGELGIRRGREIRKALDEYIRALLDTLTTLKQLCEYQQCSNSGDRPQPRTKKQALLVTYDDAVQYQQRLGARLNDLVANL